LNFSEIRAYPYQEEARPYQEEARKEDHRKGAHRQVAGEAVEAQRQSRQTLRGGAWSILWKQSFWSPSLRVEIRLHLVFNLKIGEPSFKILLTLYFASSTIDAMSDFSASR